jgi:hypothetical protein
LFPAALLFGAALGCTGDIADKDRPAGTPTDPGAGNQPGMPGPGGRPPGGGTVQPGDPNAAGPLPLHRLDHREYNNTVRDLLGDASRPADRFPADLDAEFFYRRAGLVSSQDYSTLVTAMGFPVQGFGAAGKEGTLPELSM